MIANIFLYIILILIVLIFIFIFVFLFKVSNKVKDNYKYLKDKYQELYNKIQSSTSISGINIDKILEQINNNIENVSKLKENIDQINNDLNNTDKKIKELEQTNQETVQNINTINKKLEENSKDNENIKNQIKNQNKQIDQINSEIIKINSNYDEYLKYKENIDKEINTLNQHYNDYISDKKILEDSINKRFDEVYKTIDSIKGNYDDSELRKLINNNTKSIENLNTTTLQKLNEMDEKITSITTRLENIENSITSINTDIKTLQDNISGIKKNIENINNDIKTLNTNLNNLKTNTEESINTINSNISEIQKYIKTFGEDIDSIKKNIINIEKDIASIKTNITDINSSIKNINFSIKSINDVLTNKNYIEDSYIFIYNYNLKNKTVFTNSSKDYDEIIKNFIPYNKTPNIISISNINFSKDALANIITETGNFILISKNILSNYMVCDMIYFKKNNYLSNRDINPIFIDDKKIAIISINFFSSLTDKNQYKFMIQYVFVSGNNINNTSNIDSIKTEIKKIFENNENDIFKVNLLFILSDITEENKNIIYEGIYPNKYIDSGYKSFKPFNKSIPNTLCYIGESDVFYNSLINDYNKSDNINTQVTSLVLKSKLLYDISYN